MITGFRLGPAGAQGRYGITPDLSMFGKVAGGGLPLAALGGRAEVMDHLAPLGPVYQAGTLSGNPLATAAGLAVLDAARPTTAYAEPRSQGRRASPTACTKALPDAQVTQVGTLTGFFFTDQPVTNYERGPDRPTTPRYAQLFHHLLARGHFLAPSGYETLFVSPRARPTTNHRRAPSQRRERQRRARLLAELAEHCSNAEWAPAIGAVR